VGGGASTLVDDLLTDSYCHLTVLDLSAAALKVAQSRIGDTAHKVRWIEGDVTTLDLDKHSINVWHDRAVFHFFTESEQRELYFHTLLNAVKPGGHVIVATFAEDGPEECSGLPIQRYSVEQLKSEFGASFQMSEHYIELHETPFGTTQNFVYCHFQRIK